ncbi:MAG: type III-B CRISPR-associated protein Cas10/Cmr2, partial [Methanobacteriota archaeon]
IGLIPVQSFISEARRLRDLKAGSAMLSWFMARGLERLREKAGEFNLIIPYGNAFQELAELNIIEVLSQPRYSLPNRASGYLILNQSVSVEEVFKKALPNGLQDDWEEVFKAAFPSGRPHPFAGIELTSEEERRLQEDFSKAPPCPLEFIWAVALAEEDGTLPNDLQRIDRLYEAVKTARPIPVRNGNPLYTCSQCGAREEYAPVNTFDDAIAWWNKVRHSPDFQKGYRLKTGENLCKVCLTKRLVSYQKDIEHAFKSTSAIAARSWVYEVTRLAVQEASSVLQTSLQNYQTLLDQIARKEIDDPEGLYYSDDLRQWIRKPNLPEDVLQLLENIINARKTLNDTLEIIAPELRTEPSDYLAVLVFDGDDMGKRSREQGVPQKMDEFGRTVFQLLTEGELSNKGVEVVYIGGDEGLLLVPIQNALEVATLIRQKFAEVFNQEENISNPFTLSAGLCFFNRQRPMGAAIQMAHAA